MQPCTVETLRGATTPITSYDPTKVNLGSLIIQNKGTGSVDNWCGPVPIGFAHSAEDGIAPTVQQNPVAVKWSSTTDWVFFTSGTAAISRPVVLYSSNILTGVMTVKGFITATFPAATNHTIRDMAVDVQTYITGTVAVSGTAVTGTSTAWQTAGMAAGARIGFGSTDPTAITTWYYVSSIGSDTTITLTGAVNATIGAGSTYVIEEIRVILATTNATATNGGLHIVKGLNFDVFTPIGSTIAAAVSTDNVQAVYWLADAATETNTTACGIALAPKTSNMQHDCYVMDGGGTATGKIYKYNLRAPLTVSSGKDSGNSLTLSTGSLPVIANINALRAICYASAGHGIGSGVASIYLLAGTGSNILRAPIAMIANGATSCFQDQMPLNLPSNLIAGLVKIAGRGIVYDSVTDTFMLGAGTSGTNLSPLAATKYRRSGMMVGPLVDINDPYSLLIAAPASTSRHFNVPSASAFVADLCTSPSGIMYLIAGASQSTNFFTALFSLPSGAHWTYVATTNQKLITPSISTPNASTFSNVFVNAVSLIAPEPDPEVSWNADAWRIYARTSGITDNSGTWQLLNDTGDLSAFAGANAIQFMFEFRTFSHQCLPARILSLCVVYNTVDSIQAQYEWSAFDSNTSNGTVGFNQIGLYGSVPTFTISYFRADQTAAVFSQASTGSTNGNFQFWNGSSWVNGTGSDKIGQRRRFVPTASLPSGVTVRTTIVTS